MPSPILTIANGKLATHPATYVPGTGHLLITGTTGAGKSSWINSAVGQAAPHPTIQLVGVDLKRVELNPWAKRLSLLARTFPECDQLGTALNQLLDARIIQAEANNWRAWPISIAHPAVLIVIDELAEALRSEPLTDAIDRIGRLGRFVGLGMIAATQQANAKVLGGSDLRSLFTRRAALFDPEAISYRMVLGEHGPKEHASLLAWLAMDRPGLAVWCDPYTRSNPWLTRAPYWTDADVDHQAAATARYRRPITTLETVAA